MVSSLRVVPLLMTVTCLAAGAAAQVRVPRGQANTTVPVTIALKVGGNAYNFSGQAACRHAPRAAIYGMLAEQYGVEHHGEGANVTLTMWRPKPQGSEDMLSLGVSVKGKSHAVDTVKVGAQGQPRGSGKVTFVPAGSGGTFTLDVTDAAGTRIAGTIKCDAFTAPEAVAGN